MDVQMPDGTIVTGVPDDVTQSALLERYKSYQPPAGLASLPSALPPTSNPLYGLVSRTGSLIGEGIEGVARVAEKVGDKLEGVLPLSNLTAEQIANQRQLEPLFKFAESTKNWAKGINYEPSTKLADLASNPLNAVPFIVERVISSSPDMAASVVAMPAYVSARTNEILNDRLKNDEKKLDDATVADVTAALGGAIMESTLERFATKHLFKGKPVSGKSATTRVAKEVGIQSGTEGAEEAIGYLAGTVGTKKGVDSKELGESILEGAIVGGGLGGGVRGTREYLDYRKKKQEAADSLTKEDEGEIPPIEDTIQTSETIGDLSNATNPIVATTTTTVDGKESVKTRRADGSVYVDGVMVEPPRQAPEGDVAQSREQMLAEFEGRQLPPAEQPADQTPPVVPQDTAGLNDGDLELLAQVTATQPAQFTDPDTGTAIIISLTKLNDPTLKAGEEVVYGGKTYYTYVQIPQKDTSGQLELAPVNPEGTVLPTPAPPAAPVATKSSSLSAEDVILQNRERSSPTSIAQMNGIANKPDYSRVSFSNSFTEGAPVIFGSQSLPNTQLGRKGTVVAGKTNRKIPVQYAVVEADQMVASNAVDGSSIPEYANPSFTGFRAVTNGRVAGLKEGYKRGTMGQYKQDLLGDDIHGISPDVISKMRNPVLVRVMPQDQVTKDIADESNTSSTLSLSATERAKNDANRIDLEGLSFRDDGAISPETVRGFVASMPQAEQQELIDNQGRPSRQAYDRLNAAIFYKAYGSDALVALAAEAKSVDAANIINGLSQSAPQMAQLSGLGEYDIRPQVVEAAEIAINANRQGQKLADVIAQQELISQDSIAKEVLQLFANNTRSAKKIGEGLRRIANDVNAEASRSQEPDMFGEVPAKKSAANVVEETSRQIMIDAGYVERELGIAGFLKASEELKAEIAALELQMQSFGLDSAEIMSEIKSGPTLTPLEYYSRAIKELGKAIAQAAKQGSDNNIGKVNVSPVSEGIENPTEAGLKAKQDAIDKAAAEKAKADREAAAKDKAEADRKAIAAASEKAAGEFELGKSAEDDLSGQEDIFGGARQLPELDTTGLKIPKGRNPQVVAAGKLFQAGKMSRAEFNEYVAQYTPVAEVPADKIEPPTTLEKILGFFKSPKETERVQKVIPNGTRVGLRMDVPALNAGLPVVSIHEGKINPKTGKPFASAGSVIKYASTGHIKNVTFAPRSQEKSLNMGLNPVKEPLQTAEGEWVNSTPEETFKRVKELSNDKSWTQVGFDPARHGYFYERSTGEPVASASEVYQVGRFLLAKDVKYAPKEDFLYNIKDVEQKENAQMVADNFKGKVVYQNGDISLIQVSNVYNDPVYLPAKGTVYFTNSVESIKDTRKLFTKEELQELLDARLNIEAQDASKHAANPFVTFKNGIATSENVSSELAGIFKQWKSLLKLNQNIYLGTIEDAIAAKDSFAGPQRRIGNAATKLNITGTPGSTQALADGTRYILIDQNQTPAELIEILAHEMGHAHEQEMFNNAPVALQNQIKAEFDKWLDSQKGKTAKEFIYALRAKETAETTVIPKPEMLAKDMKKYASYWSTFSEWYADQTARWATTSEKPLTAVDKFFAKVAETLRNFFKTLKSAGFLPNTTFKQYMDDITATEIVAANPITSINEQMPLFATKIAQANLPNMPAAPNKPNKISPASLQKPKPAASWTAPDMNRKDTFIGLIQDRNISLKRVQQTIEKLPTVTQLQDNLNAYRLEDLAHGRVQVQTDDFLKFEFGPIVKEMNDNKVTEEQLTEYLLNRHAKEANELIAKRNPNNPAMQDKGSSVETKDAQDYLNNLPLAQKRVFESIAKKVDKIIEGTQDLLLKNGIISKAELFGPDKNTAAENKRLKLGWRNMFEHYVPLRREETDYVLPSSSFKEIGSYSKSRTGSQKKVTDILSNVGIAREIAIVRSEKEKAKRAVYGLAVANPNPEFWMAVSPAAVLNQNLLIQELSQMGWDPADAKNIMAEPTKAYFNKDTGLVEHKINTQNRYADFVLPVKINGQDRFVFFNPNDERAASVITALKKADTQKLNAINSYVGNITRYFAAVNTQYNLVFGAWNFARDVQGAMFNLTTTPLNGKQSAVFQGTFTALKDIYAGIKEKNKGTLQKNPADGSWQDFLEAGGKIGYRDQFAKINDTSTLVARELKSLNRGNAYKTARSMLNWVSSVNDVLENAVRLSAYRVALKQNLSKDQAAEIAKNLTVNFNRKGSATAGLSAYYAFLNASIQGTARLAQTIDPRTKSGKLIIAGGLAIGMAQSLALMAAGFDDDEPSEFLKERNLIIPTGWLTGKRTYAMWPMPLGFNILPNTGRLLIDGAARLADGKGVGDLAINALSMAVSSTNPLGGNAATLQSYMPTIADPFVAVYENKDAFGRPIAKEDRGLNPTPGYTRSREPANPIFQGIAEFMNTVTSRDPDVKGLISPTADQLSYIAEQIGGGVYREASRAVKYAVNVLNGEETPEHQVPLAGKIIGDLGSNSAISQKFYTNVKNMAEHELVIKAHRERRQSTAEYMRDNPEARLWQRANSLENEITKLNKTKKELYQREAPKDRIKRVEDQKIRMMQQFNDQVRRVN
jgi:hypothetical protein